MSDPSFSTTASVPSSGLGARLRSLRVAAGLTQTDEVWGRHYNVACYLALAGEHDAAFEHLRTAVELDRDKVMKWLPEDSDLDPLRDDPRFKELAG